MRAKALHRPLLLLVAGAALFAIPAGAAVPKNPVAPGGSPAAAAAPNGDAVVARAAQLAQTGDCKGVLALLDPLVAGAAAPGSASRFSAQLLRMPCLGSVGRAGEIAPVLAELKAQAPDNPLVQGFQVFVDLDAGRFAQAADGLATIADARSRALTLMPGDLWRALSQQLMSAGDYQRRDRVSLALALADWNPTDRPEMAETLAVDGIGALVDKHAVDDARQMLDRVHRPYYLWEMAIQRRYAALWPDVETRIGAQGGTAIDRFARSSLDAYADDQQDSQATLDAARAFLFLRRFDDVVATASATTIKPGMTEEQAATVITESDALAAAGRRTDALARLRPFTAPGLAGTPDAAGALITLAQLLDEDGRYDEALTVARTALASRAGDLSPYGIAWLRRSEVCALAALKRGDEERIAADRLKASAQDNQAAAVEGLLCAGRDGEAAAIAIATLATPEGADRIADQFQPDAAMLPHSPSRLHLLWDRLLARPDVKASFERTARILPKLYWPSATPRALPAPTAVQDAASTT